MARAEFWRRQETRLLGPFGSFADIPMEDEALVANGPSMATTDAVRLLVLGHKKEAYATLDDFIPRLQTYVTDTGNWPSPNDPRNVRGKFSYLAADASVAYWIRSGSIDSALAQIAFSRFAARAEHEKPDGPELLHFMLSALEAGQMTEAKRFYQIWEPSPLQAAPPTYRFSSNARHVLFLCLLSRESREGVEVATEGLNRFRIRATKWEKGPQPVPYVSIVQLARLLTAGHDLVGKTLSQDELWRMLK